MTESYNYDRNQAQSLRFFVKPVFHFETDGIPVSRSVDLNQHPLFSWRRLIGGCRQFVADSLETGSTLAEHPCSRRRPSFKCDPSVALSRQRRAIVSKSSSEVPRGRLCRRERLAHSIQKFLRYNSTEHNRAESYCCRALCRMASDIHQRKHPQGINTEMPLHVLSPKNLFIEFQPISEILAKILIIGHLQVPHITRLNAENRTRERKKCLKAALCADSVTAISLTRLEMPRSL